MRSHLKNMDKRLTQDDKSILIGIMLNSKNNNLFIIEVLKMAFFMLKLNIRLKINSKIEKFFGIKKQKERY